MLYLYKEVPSTIKSSFTFLCAVFYGLILRGQTYIRATFRHYTMEVIPVVTASLCGSWAQPSSGMYLMFIWSSSYLCYSGVSVLAVMPVLSLKLQTLAVSRSRWCNSVAFRVRNHSFYMALSDVRRILLPRVVASLRVALLRFYYVLVCELVGDLSSFSSHVFL